MASWAGPTLTICGDRKVSFYGLWGVSYQLEKSSDLKTWNPSGPAIIGADRHEVLNLGARTGGAEFWRLRAQ